MQPLGCPFPQALQYLPISKALSVAVDEVPEVGQENEKFPVDDTDPDIQGSASPDSMNTSVSGKKSSFPLGNVEKRL